MDPQQIPGNTAIIGPVMTLMLNSDVVENIGQVNILYAEAAAD